jgi:hypothetical protein
MMGSHIVDGQFQSDKYPTTPRGKVPLSVNDKLAQPLLWEYAQRRRSVDAEFSADLETALVAAGFEQGSEVTVVLPRALVEDITSLLGALSIEMRPYLFGKLADAKIALVAAVIAQVPPKEGA